MTPSNESIAPRLPIHRLSALPGSLVVAMLIASLATVAGCGRKHSDTRASVSAQPEAAQPEAVQRESVQTPPNPVADAPAPRDWADPIVSMAGNDPAHIDQAHVGAVEALPSIAAEATRASEQPATGHASAAIATAPKATAAAAAAPTRRAAAIRPGAATAVAPAIRAPVPTRSSISGRSISSNSINSATVDSEIISAEITAGSASTADPDIADPEIAAAAAPEAGSLSLDQAADDPTTTAPDAASDIDNDAAFITVPVYYATDRQHDHLPLSAYELTGHKRTVMILSGCFLFLLAVSMLSLWRGRGRTSAVASLAAGLTGILAAAYVLTGNAHITKHGVTYSGGRGALTRGICEVSIPKVHRPGVVERPSLLRFEFHEDQQQHIVLTSATELSEADFHGHLSASVAASPAQDLLVFIHGYNVDFQSAVRRTAQISVDLPFEGVPVCYSWPSRGTLLGYSVDETNAEWTTTHLKQFLLELAEHSGASSINVIAHSMGNRPMTAAMQQISWQLDAAAGKPFDRVVLAAPDVDADRFRRDFGPSLLDVANHVTLYASSDDQALMISKGVHGYQRAGESGQYVVVVPGVETIDVSGIDLSLLGHSYYGDSESMLRDLYKVVRARLSAANRPGLIARHSGEMIYWQLAQAPADSTTR